MSRKIMQDMSLMRAWRQIPPASIVGLLDIVRNRVLSFALEIESEAPTAGESLHNETPIPKERITQIFQTYIMGDVNTMSQGEKRITQNITIEVSKGNFESLKLYLEKIGVTNNDIELLDMAIKDDGDVKVKTKIGMRVSEWIGKMVSKAVSGVWEISTTVAADILAKVIDRYYGIN